MVCYIIRNGCDEFGIKLLCCVKGSFLLFFVFIFKDTFKLHQIVNGIKKEVPFDGKGIAWWTDYNIKYRNPSITPLKNAFNGTELSKICCYLMLVVFKQSYNADYWLVTNLLQSGKKVVSKGV